MSLITLAIAKRYLRVPHAADNDLIQILVDGAEEFIEKLCGIGLTQAAKVEHLDGGGRWLWPSRLPIVSITNIYDNEAESVVDSSLYSLYGRTRLQYASEDGWPSGEQRYQASYVGGYGATIDPPGGLQLVILKLVYRAYFNRGGLSGEQAMGWGFQWQELAKSDLMAELRSYTLGKAVL